MCWCLSVISSLFSVLIMENFVMNIITEAEYLQIKLTYLGQIYLVCLLFII